MKKSHFRINFILSILCFYGLMSSLNAQTLLIEGSSRNIENLPQTGKTNYNRVTKSDMYLSHHLIEFKSLADAQKNGKIKVNLPDDDCEDLIFQAKSVEYVSENEYYWYGELKEHEGENDCYCQLGTMMLISSEHGKIGHIVVDDKTYSLSEIESESTYMLSLLDNSRFTGNECAVTKDTPIGKSEPTNQEKNGNGETACTVNCLVLFTNAAEVAEGGVAGLNNRVNLAIGQTNQALRNSEVSACELTVELVGVVPTNFGETADIAVDVANLGNDPNIQTLRNNFQADIVILLTNGNFGGGTIFGVVQAIGPDNAQAYAIVETGEATTGRFTFAHEVGHLFGAGHENDPRPGIPHGHDFKTGNFLPCIFGKRQRTILHTMPAGETRILHYSNPDVEFDGKKTGKDSERENANQMRGTACRVAAFRETLIPVQVFISGENYVCPCDNASIHANIFSGTAGATFTYVWETSNDGINWNTSTTYTGDGIAVNMPCDVGEIVFVRVTVTSSDGTTSTDQTTIETAMQWAGQEISCNQHFTGGNNQFNLSQISISPNPSSVNSDVSISYKIAVKGLYSVSIRNINGEVVERILNNEYLENGVFSQRVNLTNKGLHFVEIIDEQGFVITKKFVLF